MEAIEILKKFSNFELVLLMIAMIAVIVLGNAFTHTPYLVLWCLGYLLKGTGSLVGGAGFVALVQKVARG